MNRGTFAFAVVAVFCLTFAAWLYLAAPVTRYGQECGTIRDPANRSFDCLDARRAQMGVGFIAFGFGTAVAIGIGFDVWRQKKPPTSPVRAGRPGA